MTRLERYVAATVLRSFMLSAAALTALFSLLDFVDQLGAVGQGNYRLGDALTYVVLTVPLRLLQVMPAAMLLGSLLGLGLLARQSELVVMQSLGLPARRIIGAVVKLAVPIVIVLALLAQYVVPPAQALAEARRLAAVSAAAPMRSGDGFWAQGAGQFLNVQRFRYGNIPENLDIYAFTPDGSLGSAIHAARADIEPDGTWLLSGATETSIDSLQIHVRQLGRLPWHAFIPPGEIRLLMLAPDAMPPVALYEYVRDLQHRHQQALRYKQELWSRLGIPLSMLAMILIAAPFVFGAPRAASAGQQIMFGGLLGIAFLFTQQIAAYLGLLLGIDPAATVLAPPLLLMAVAVVLLGRLRR